MKEMSEGKDIVFSMKLPGQDGKSILISKGTKVRHKETKIRYTVTHVNEDGCTLELRKGKTIPVSPEQLEKEYDLE